MRGAASGSAQQVARKSLRMLRTPHAYGDALSRPWIVIPAAARDPPSIGGIRDFDVDAGISGPTEVKRDVVLRVVTGSGVDEPRPDEISCAGAVDTHLGSG